jgi:hypothetical protein
LIFPDPITFRVTNNNWPDNLFVNILIDNNEDGDWGDPGEWAVQNMEINVPAGQSEAFETEVSLPPRTWMRMTLTSEPLANYVGTGEFKIGETEDHYYDNAQPPPELCWFNLELEPEEQSVPHGEEVGIRIVLSPLSTSVPEVEIRRVGAGVLYPPFFGLPEPAQVEGVPPDIEVDQPIGIIAPDPVQILNLRIDPPDPGDPADTLGWIRFDTVLDPPERIEVIVITVRGRSPQRVDLETAEVRVYHHRPVRFLKLSVDSPKTAGQSSPITVRAYDAENNPVSGAKISLAAIAMDGEYAGDYEIEIELVQTELAGVYTASLNSTWAGTYRLIASVDEARAEGEVTFETGAPVDIVVSIEGEEPGPSGPPLGDSFFDVFVFFHFVDEYGNSIPPDNVKPDIYLQPGINWLMGAPASLPNGVFSFSVASDNWGTATISITENTYGLSENIDVTVEPLYFETEQDLAPLSLELTSPENLEMVATWPDNKLSVKIGVFFPPAYNELASYEMTLKYDSSKLRLIGARDWDTTDGFSGPSLTVLGENSLFKISQTGSAPAGGVNLAIVDFEPLVAGEMTHIDVTDLKLDKRISEPVYGQEPVHDEKGMPTGEYRTVVVGYTYAIHPVSVPIPPTITVKPLKRLLVPMKFWIVDNSGQTEADIDREVKEIEDTYNKAAKDCKLKYHIVVIPEINRVPKSTWDNIVGADGELSDAEWLKLDNYRYAPGVSVEGYKKWINVFLVPTSTLEDNAIGWWDPRNGSIASDQGKDKAAHDRNLAHELMHEFSKSRIKDSPDAGSAAQGGRDPNNIMRYCGGGKEISDKQGEILNEELDKRAQKIDDSYIYRP